MAPKAAEAKKEISGFEAPLEFLDGFTDEGTPYEGLYAHLATELELGHETGLREEISALSFDISEIETHRRLLAQLLDQQAKSKYLPGTKKYMPQIAASINYLKYRLAVGLMEPAMGIALDNTKPEHTHVRATRMIVAADMVRSWVNDVFSSQETAVTATSFMDQEVDGYLRQYFNETYQGASDEVAPYYLNSGYAPPNVQPDNTGYRLFDIKDFSFRMLHIKDGTLPTVDELEEIRARNNGHTNGQPEGFPNRSTRGLLFHETERIREQTHQLALAGLGVLSVNGAREAESPTLLTSATERFLPGGRLEGREIARATLFEILGRLPKPAKPKDGEKKPPKTKRDIEREKIESLLDQYRDPWMPVDALFLAAEREYVARYGEPTSKRDFWE
jgi:hypothetical protein